MNDKQFDSMLKEKLTKEKVEVEIDLSSIIDNVEKTKSNSRIQVLSIAACIVAIIFITFVFAFQKKNEIAMENEPYSNVKVDTFSYLMYDKVDVTKIFDLPQDYSIGDAIDDGALCFAFPMGNVGKYYEFMEKYNNKQDAFLRYVSSEEGDTIIVDVRYNSSEDKVYVIRDLTRDRYSSKEDRKLYYYAFEKLIEVDVPEDDYLTKRLIAYNGEFHWDVNDENIMVLFGIM